MGLAGKVLQPVTLKVRAARFKPPLGLLLASILVAIAVTLTAWAWWRFSLGAAQQVFVLGVYLSVVMFLVSTWMWVRHSGLAGGLKESYSSFILGPRPDNPLMFKLWVWGRLAFFFWVLGGLSMGALVVTSSMQ
jgi:hypothetical protein